MWCKDWCVTLNGERPFHKLKTTGLGTKLRQNYEVLDYYFATEDSYQIASENIRVIEKILEERKTTMPKDCKIIDRILSRYKKFEVCDEKC